MNRQSVVSAVWGNEALRKSHLIAQAGTQGGLALWILQTWPSGGHSLFLRFNRFPIAATRDEGHLGGESRATRRRLRETLAMLLLQYPSRARETAPSVSPWYGPQDAQIPRGFGMW
jgi:hypothetical protein